MHGPRFAVTICLCKIIIAFCQPTARSPMSTVAPLCIAFCAVFLIIILSALVVYCIIKRTERRSDFQPKPYECPAEPDLCITIPLPKPFGRETSESLSDESTQSTQRSHKEVTIRKTSATIDYTEDSTAQPWNPNSSNDHSPACDNLTNEAIEEMLGKEEILQENRSTDGRLPVQVASALQEKIRDSQGINDELYISLSDSEDSTNDAEGDQRGSSETKSSQKQMSKNPSIAQSPLEGDLRAERARRCSRKSIDVALAHSPQSSPKGHVDRVSQQPAVETTGIQKMPVNEVATPRHTPLKAALPYSRPPALSAEAINLSADRHGSGSQDTMHEHLSRVVRIPDRTPPPPSHFFAKETNDNCSSGKVGDGHQFICSTGNEADSDNGKINSIVQQAQRIRRHRYPSSGLYSSQIVEFTPTNASDLSGRSSTNVTHVRSDGSRQVTPRKAAT